jgi:dipeptidyl aminopeptidase/acylaminoacyl peptidase
MTLVTALATTIAVVAVEPAGSAERDRGRDRRDRDQERSSRFRHRGGSASMPAGFVAEQAGRLVIVSAETGRVERPLTAEQPGGGAAEPVISPDGRTVWFSRGNGSCAAYVASVPVAGGREERLPGSGEAGPEGNPLPRPGRGQLAFARTDCDDGGHTLVVGDLEGLEGYGQTGLVPLAWSRDGDHLLATAGDAHGDDAAEVELLDVDARGVIVDRRPLRPADRSAGCRLQVVGFSPDDNNGYVAIRRCSRSGSDGTRRSLVVLDKDGAVRQTVVRLPRGNEFTDRPAFDATGHSLLYSSVPEGARRGAAEVTLWLWRDGETRILARGSRFRHPAWLP